MSSLTTLLEHFAGRRVLVVGDLMLDEYIWGHATRISPEAPVMVVDSLRESHVPGGAANVAHNVVSLGGAANVVGVIGSDDAGRDLVSKLQELRIGTNAVMVDAARRTTRKTRIIAHHQQVLRVDWENRSDVAKGSTAELCDRIDELLPQAHAVILSDYRKGCLTPQLCGHVIDQALERHIPVAANPKPPSIEHYRRATVVSLNRVETEALVGRQLEGANDVERACDDRRRELGIESLLVTLGDEGLVILDDEGAEVVPAIRVEVYDTAGAGDTVVAATTLALAAGAPKKMAAKLANLAAGCVVRRIGVATPDPHEMVMLAEANHYEI